MRHAGADAFYETFRLPIYLMRHAGTDASYETFRLWLEACLVPHLHPGEWVIVENAMFHHGGRLAQLIEAGGCHLVYFPPYSPDLNRIEKCWAWLKSRIRKQLPTASSLRAAMEAVLKQAAS